ncbi:hypothetical protein QGP82_05350 [Leptothoe sp. LEGE 181152]|nr:hypothetical protein [Leptothoe sp. LEGE 181152]
MSESKTTANEILKSLQRSELINIIVEGKDELIIYRWLENKLRLTSKKINFLVCDGRETLLKVYERIGDLGDDKLVIFLADKDVWLYSKIPEKYSSIIWTDGYSIENDVYAGSDLENLLDKDEAVRHQKIIFELCKWYAFEIEKYLSSGEQPEIAHNINRICVKGREELCEKFLEMVAYKEPSDEIRQAIHNDYQLKLRGKLLMSALLRFLSYSNREVKHSRKSLLEMAIKYKENGCLLEKIEVIENKIRAHRRLIT